MNGLNRILIVFLMVGWTGGLQVLAQEDTSSDGDIQDAEIVIEKNREIKLPRETKVYEYIKWQPKSREVDLPKSNFINYQYERPLIPIEFSPVALPVASKEKSYYQYAKVGFGNYASPLVDVSLVTMDNVNRVVGLNYKHLSFAKGQVDGENSASSLHEVGAYMQLIGDYVKVKPSLSYKFDKNYFYGYPNGTVVNRENIKKANQYFDAGVELADNNQDDSWSYGLDAGLKHFSDNYSNKENTIGVKPVVGYDERIYVEADLAWSKYENTTSISRSIYRVKPFYHLTLGELEADLGLSLNFQNDTLNNLSDKKIFPYVDARFALTNDYQVFVKLDAGYDFNSMYTLNGSMPYLNPVFGVSNSIREIDLKGGVRGNFSDAGSVEVRTGYQSMKNLAIFVNSPVDQSLMNVVYDDKAVGIFNVGLTSKYEFDKSNNLTFDFNYYAFNTGSLPQVYHRPTMEITLKGDHQWIEKLNVQWKLGVLSGIKAYDPNTDTEVGLDLIPKLDLLTHYQIKDQWGAFASFENIFNKSYSRYLFYPQRGIAFKLGVTYRF